MTLPKDVAYDVIRIQLRRDSGELSDSEFVDALSAVVDQVKDPKDVFALLLRVSTVACGATKLAARELGQTPESLVEDARAWFNQSGDPA